MKLVQILLVILLLVLGSLVSYSLTVGKGSPEVRAVKERSEKLHKALLAKLPSIKRKAEVEVDTKPEDQFLAAALRAALDSMFLERSGFHFSRSLWGAEPVPYQFRGLRVGKAEALADDPGDRLKGIDRRVHIPITVEAFRRYDRDQGWGRWETSDAPNLEGLTFVREAGKWQPLVPPDQFYSVR